MHGLRGCNHIGTEHSHAGRSGMRGPVAGCGNGAEFRRSCKNHDRAWADAWWPRQQWDYAWGAPPYSFPQGHQSHVMYYAAAPYYYLGFQTSMGYNGHFGYPAAVQYADPPGPRRFYSRPHRIEAFD